MAGETTTGSLSDSLPLVLDSARIRREYPPVVPKLFEYHKLDDNTGLSWEEIELGRFTAQSITETTRLDNYQQYADTMARLTPTVSGLATLVTDRVYHRLSNNVLAQFGGLLQDAIERKKDLDCLTVLDGATNSTPGAGNTLSSSHLTAAHANSAGNATEGGVTPFYAVLHRFQIKDIQDELNSAIGTYPIPAGLTEEVFKMGFAGMIDGMSIYEDNNIPIDSAADSKGGVFPRMGCLFVQGISRRKPTVRDEEYGGGADKVFLYDEYIAGERLSNNTSVFPWEIYSDTTAPA